MKLKIPHDIGKSTGIKTKERKEQNYLQDEYICIYFLVHSRNLANCGKLNIKRIQIQKSKTLKYPPANNFNSGISTIPLYQFCLIRKQNKWKTHGGGRGEEEEEYIFTYRARWINKTTIWNFVAFRNYPVYTCTMPIHTHLARIKRGRMDGQEINYFFAGDHGSARVSFYSRRSKTAEKPSASLFIRPSKLRCALSGHKNSPHLSLLLPSPNPCRD